jgi:hypothetical protein
MVSYEKSPSQYNLFWRLAKKKAIERTRKGKQGEERERE